MSRSKMRTSLCVYTSAFRPNMDTNPSWLSCPSSSGLPSRKNSCRRMSASVVCLSEPWRLEKNVKELLRRSAVEKSSTL